MHPSAFKLGRFFFETYLQQIAPGNVVDVGSMDVNGSLRVHCPAHHKYIGVDFAAGNGVDVVLEDPYFLPFADASIDAVVSSSCFEHSEMFWLVFLEILRVLKPDGLLYLNAPSNGAFHRFPVDCWRFYPDAGNALVTWAKRNRYDPLLLESFVARQDGETWNDFVAVFVKERAHAAAHPRRLLSFITDFSNGQVAGTPGFLNLRGLPEDIEKLVLINKITAGLVKTP